MPSKLQTAPLCLSSKVANWGQAMSLGVGSGRVVVSYHGN